MAYIVPSTRHQNRITPCAAILPHYQERLCTGASRTEPHSLMEKLSPWQEASTSKPEEDPFLKAALEGSLNDLLHLPPTIEADFRQHSRGRAAALMHQFVYGLIALYLLVVVPIFLMSDDPGMPLWITFSMLPMAVVLGGMWVATRLPTLDAHVETTLGLSLFFCLLSTVYCAILLEGQYFGQMAAYESIYILVIAFSTLQLPARLALGWSLTAFVLALAIALLLGHRPYWLDVMLYFGIPLIICTVNGYILEYSARRNFVQNLLLNHERQHMELLREQAQHETRRQQQHAEFLALISGNLALHELLTRTLRFLVEHTDAQVATAYHVGNDGRLERICSWAMDDQALSGRQSVTPQETLMGPALESGTLMLLENIRADYLPIKLGMGTLPSVSIMVVPVRQEAQPLAVIELGRIHAFTETDCAIADALRQHLAYAIVAANAREQAAGTASAVTG